MEFNKDQYFQRQMALSEIGKEGQALLQKAKVLVIGCGGLGSPIAIYLATSGIGELHLVDFDTVAVSNLHRQVFFRVEDVELPKVEVLANEIKKRAPFTKVSYTNSAVDKNSIIALVSEFDVVVDGTDSLPVKYLINDALWYMVLYISLTDTCQHLIYLMGEVIIPVICEMLFLK
jgi:adenylyltransferase/sulfurtransferase